MRPNRGQDTMIFSAEQGRGNRPYGVLCGLLMSPWTFLMRPPEDIFRSAGRWMGYSDGTAVCLCFEIRQAW